MNKTMHYLGVTLGAVTIAVLGGSIGIQIGAGYLFGDDPNKLVIPLLSMIGGWISGIGALIAVVVALKISDYQIRHAHQQDAIRCIHHSLAIINDLRGRVHSVAMTLGEGNRPLLALTRNAEAIERRYEMLYDRDLYRHMPGPLVDKITGMSGSFFGLFALVEALALTLNIKPDQPIPPPSGDARKPLLGLLKKLEDELGEIAGDFLIARKAVVKL